jgi:hypothetical protein
VSYSGTVKIKASALETFFLKLTSTTATKKQNKMAAAEEPEATRSAEVDGSQCAFAASRQKKETEEATQATKRQRHKTWLACFGFAAYVLPRSNLPATIN